MLDMSGHPVHHLVYRLVTLSTLILKPLTLLTLRTVVGLVAPSADYIIITTSLYFVRSGWINIINASINVVGRYSDQWSSSIASNIWGNSSTGAFYFHFDETKANPAYGGAERWRGIPLSCPAPLLFLLIKIKTITSMLPFYTSCAAGILLLVVVAYGVLAKMATIGYLLLHLEFGTVQLRLVHTSSVFILPPSALQLVQIIAEMASPSAV